MNYFYNLGPGCTLRGSLIWICTDFSGLSVNTLQMAIYCCPKFENQPGKDCIYQDRFYLALDVLLFFIVVYCYLFFLSLVV